MTVDFIGYIYSGKTSTARFLSTQYKSVLLWNPINNFSSIIERKVNSFDKNKEITIDGFSLPNDLKLFLEKLSKDVHYLKKFYFYIFNNFKDPSVNTDNKLIIRELNPFLGSLYGFSNEVFYFKEIKLNEYSNICREGWTRDNILNIRKKQKALTSAIKLPNFTNIIDITKYSDAIKLKNRFKNYANNSYYR